MRVGLRLGLPPPNCNDGARTHHPTGLRFPGHRQIREYEFASRTHYGDSLLDSTAGAARCRGDNAAIEAVVAGLEKHGFAPIAALGDMVGSARSCKLSP